MPADAEGGLDKGSALWTNEGFLGGYSTPVIDGSRVYQVDNGANLVAFDVEDGGEVCIDYVKAGCPRARH